MLHQEMPLASPWYVKPGAESKYLQSNHKRETNQNQGGFGDNSGPKKSWNDILEHPNISWIIEKARSFQKNIYFCFIDYTKAFDSVDHNKLWKILKKMGVPDHLICLMRKLYVSQEETVRTVHRTTD